MRVCGILCGLSLQFLHFNFLHVSKPWGLYLSFGLFRTILWSDHCGDQTDVLEHGCNCASGEFNPISLEGLI